MLNDNGLLTQIEDYTDPRSQCFLCSKSTILDSHKEHVIPSWAQEKYKLWNQELKLLNGSYIFYRQLTVSCCFECNNQYLQPLENELCEKVELGRKEVLSVDPIKLFLWLGKIFFGIIYKELTLLADRSNPKSRTIVEPEFIKLYKMHRLFLQQARKLVHFQDGDDSSKSTPGSIFVFDMQDLPDKKMEWDFIDNVDTLFIGIRIGKVGIIALLQDGGAAQIYENMYKKFYDFKLHPIQFREICAMLSYQSSISTRTPKYITILNQPMNILQMPLAGFSSKPLYYNWNMKDYAEILSQYTGIPMEHIFQPPDKTRTWLENAQNEVLYMDIKKFPIS